MRLKADEKRWLSKQTKRCFTCKHLDVLHDRVEEDFCQVCGCTGPVDRPIEGPVSKEWAELNEVTKKFFVPLITERILGKRRTDGRP
jgi:hypothetical protein